MFSDLPGIQKTGESVATCWLAGEGPVIPCLVWKATIRMNSTMQTAKTSQKTMHQFPVPAIVKLPKRGPK